MSPLYYHHLLPLPIPMQKMYIVVPDYLVAEEEIMEETNFYTHGLLRENME